MPWYLYLALKQLFSTFQRLFFTGIAVVSVTLGVALLVVVLSVMGGFGDKLNEMTRETQGDIALGSDAPIYRPEALEAAVAKIPGVVAETPFANGPVVILQGDTPAFPFMQGVDVETVEKVAPLGKYVRIGSLDDLDDQSIILSSELAQNLGAGLGSKVEIVSPATVRDFLRGGEYTLPREFTVVGIFQIGHQLLDKSTVIVTLRTMQDLYKLGDGIHGLYLKITPGLEVNQETSIVNQALAHDQGKAFPRIPGLWARSWKQANQDFLWAVQMEKSIMTLLLLIVVLVAAFLNMSLLIVLVIKKTREIGLLASLGASRLQIGLCFCIQGVWIGVIGTGLGLVLGFTILHFRNDLVAFVTRFTGSEQAIANVYQFTQLPAHTEPSDLVIIVCSAIILSTLAGLIPAFLASRLNPVEALRNE